MRGRERHDLLVLGGTNGEVVVAQAAEVVQGPVPLLVLLARRLVALHQSGADLCTFRAGFACEMGV